MQRQKLRSNRKKVWTSQWSVILRTFYRQILSLLYGSFFFWNFRHRLARELLVPWANVDAPSSSSLGCVCTRKRSINPHPVVFLYAFKCLPYRCKQICWLIFADLLLTRVLLFLQLHSRKEAEICQMLCWRKADFLFSPSCWQHF